MDYGRLSAGLRSLIADSHPLSAISNAASFIFNELQDVSWVGFYISDGKDLILGPFQGKPACVRISEGRGVCGRSFTSGKTILVDDVRTFEGHISCDPDSRSEIVVPIFSFGKPVAVLDIDSKTTGRFSDDDRTGIEILAKIIEQQSGESFSSLV